MRYAYYPGCSLQGTAKEYDLSARAVCRALGIELKEIPDWNCCGASSAHATNHLLALALPARVLALAEREGLPEIAAPCAACFNRLAVTTARLNHDEVARQRINNLIEMDYRGTGRVKSMVDVVVADYGLEALREKVRRPLTGLRVAAYYGCLLVRPPDVTRFDDPENPQKMERLVEALGGEPVDWSHKVECCGMSLSVSRTDIAVRLVNEILRAARASEADCLMVACPLCQANLDLRQPDAERVYRARYNLPVYYFTQLTGVALGLDTGALGLHTHLVDPLPLLRSKKLA